MLLRWVVVSLAIAASILHACCGLNENQQRIPRLVLGLQLPHTIPTQEIAVKLHNIARSLKQDYRRLEFCFCFDEGDIRVLDSSLSRIVRLLRGVVLFNSEHTNNCGHQYAISSTETYLYINVTYWKHVQQKELIKFLREKETTGESFKNSSLMLIPCTRSGSALESMSSSLTGKYSKSIIHAEPFHDSNGCQLWWPLNHSQLFVHSVIPPNLSPLRLKQKIIFSCPHLNNRNYPDNDHIQYRFEVRINQYFTTHPSSSSQAILLGSSLPLTVDTILEVYHDDHTFTSFSVSLTVFDSNSTYTVHKYDLDLNLVFGSQHWKVAQHDKFCGETIDCRCKCCATNPMASQLDSRDDLGFALNTLLPNASSFVEVGVQHGNFAELMLNTWTNMQSYTAVDPWKEWPKHLYYDIANNHQATQDAIFASFLSRMKPFGKQVSVVRMESLDAASIFRDESVDVVYLDAMHHYRAVQQDMHAWWRKIRSGGLLAGHDYLLDVRHGTVFSVKPAVQEFARDMGLVVLYTDDSDHPSYPSWFLFKPVFC
jgi:hypothetical protein